MSVPDKKMPIRKRLSSILLNAGCVAALLVVSIGAFADVFELPVTPASLDNSTFAASFGGHEQPVMGGLTAESQPVSDGAEHIVWAPGGSHPAWDGAHFGVSKSMGTRYLRIGFAAPIPLGCVLVRGGGALSFLKAGAAYPGRLESEADWVPAQRIKNGEVSKDEAGQEDYVLWNLPAGTTTRALRFSHTSGAADPDYAGWIGGVWLLGSRFANVAPLGRASAALNGDHAARINDDVNNGTWDVWDNGSDGQASAVSPDNPTYVTLTWPKPVAIRGLCALWAGFGSAEAQVYTGKGDPRQAADAEWRAVKTFTGIQNYYPLQLGPNWMDFGHVETTRGVRLRITKVTEEGHPHLNGNTKGGKRVWLGELMALSPLGNALLVSAIPPKPAAPVSHPPIPVRFHLSKPGYVTLVIEDSGGKRVRNLVSETPYPAGDNIAWWDGLDDLGRSPDAAAHAVYYIPGTLVKKGIYRVRGLTRSKVSLRYQMTVNTHGDPAWATRDPASQWLANHSPPNATLYVPNGFDGKPAMMVGSYVTEGGSGLAWLDLSGRKLNGEGWVGGNWTGAPLLARDQGGQPASENYAYAAAAWEGELRLTQFYKGGEKPVLTPTFKFPGANADELKANSVVTGLAVYNGILVASLPKQNELLFVDVAAGKELGKLSIADPRGLAFDSKGRLLALSGKRLIRFSGAMNMPANLQAPEQIIGEGLEDPQHLTLDQDGNLYVSDLGGSHQVKVFSADGKFLRAIGHPGAPKAGAYDPAHMNNPQGVTIDSERRLWVAENDFQPKRISVWTLDGQLVKAFYGPPRYGGGGELDPRDRNSFYYDGMKFRLEWKTGESQPVDIYYRPGTDALAGLFGSGGAGPQTPLYFNGRAYLTNCYNSNPTNGPSLAGLWRMDNGIAVLAAAMGRASEWNLLKGDAFKSRLPQGVGVDGAVFIWSDRNGDGQAQPEEVTFVPGDCGGVSVMADLAFLISRTTANPAGKVDPDRQRALRFVPKFAGGLPQYDWQTAQALADQAQSPVSSGGDQALRTSDGWTVLTTAPKPFSAYGVGGVKDGVPMWSYPSLWPGLHASHNAAMPEHPGELIGTTRLVGGFVTPKSSDAGPLWAVNGNKGTTYVFTADGLFVATLFKDSRTAGWTFPLATKDMPVDEASEGEEDFWPQMTQTADGQIYLTTLCSCIVQVGGLDTIRRLPAMSLTVTPKMLDAAQAYFVRREVERQKTQEQDILTVDKRPTAPVVDGSLGEWGDARWVTIDTRTDQHGDWGHSEAKTQVALSVSGDRLYAAFRTGDANLLTNAGGNLPLLFKTGGALDLMLETASGPERLLVTLVNSKVAAVLYRPHAPDRTGEPISFTSPLRTIKFDRVDDVSSMVTLAGKDGDYELSAPLSALGLAPSAGQSIRGDIGILRGNGFQTLQRVYWRNKATELVSDIPSEAELLPQLWGTWQFR